jgi:hypothetical protein
MVFNSSRSKKHNLAIVIIAFITNHFPILFRILKLSLRIRFFNKIIFRTAIVTTTIRGYCIRHLEMISWQAFIPYPPANFSRPQLASALKFTPAFNACGGGSEINERD